MATPIRTQVKEALFDLVSEAVFPTVINGRTTWGYSSRRLKMFNNIDVSIQPALFMVQHREGYVNNRGVGVDARRWLEVGLWCFAPSGAEDIVGDDLLDSMFEAIENTLGPDDPIRNELTLGNLCYWCRITRDDNLLIRDPGDIDGQALLIVPVRILLP